MRAWGRLSGGDKPTQDVRNTPTCMGKTTCSSCRSRLAGKHPHMHGEDLIGPRPFKGFLETPPHAWGRLPCAVCEARHVGNTPTCMGKTAISTSRKSAGWKHPHMHGEDDALLLASAIDMETPPHAWGRRRPNGS